MSPSESSPPTDRRLLLMRHAKSDWAEPGLADADRPLNKRGRRDAPRMAEWLVESGNVPDMVLCSSAERTRETVDLMNEIWPDRVPVHTSGDLYLAAPETILRVIRSDGDDVARLMIVAHNPGLAELVSSASGQSSNVPTAAIAIFDASLDRWGDLRSPSQLHLVTQIRPKSLSES